MKKLIIFFLILTLLFSMTACGNGSEDQQESGTAEESYDDSGDYSAEDYDMEAITGQNQASTDGEGNDLAYGTGTDVTSQLYQYYEIVVQDVLDQIGTNQKLYNYCHGLVDDFDQDGYPEMVLTYSTDEQYIRACIVRMRLSDQAVMQQDFQVAPISGEAKCTICQGSYQEQPAIYVWFDNYKNGSYGTYYVFPLTDDGLNMATKVEYQMNSSGTGGTFTQDGTAITTLQYKKFLENIQYSLASFEQYGIGTQIDQMIPMEETY